MIRVDAGDGSEVDIYTWPPEWYRLMSPFVVLTDCDRSVDETLETIHLATELDWEAQR